MWKLCNVYKRQEKENINAFVFCWYLENLKSKFTRVHFIAHFCVIPGSLLDNQSCLGLWFLCFSVRQTRPSDSSQNSLNSHSVFCFSVCFTFPFIKFRDPCVPRWQWHFRGFRAWKYIDSRFFAWTNVLKLSLWPRTYDMSFFAHPRCHVCIKSRDL